MSSVNFGTFPRILTFAAIFFTINFIWHSFEIFLSITNAKLFLFYESHFDLRSNRNEFDHRKSFKLDFTSSKQIRQYLAFTVVVATVIRDFRALLHIRKAHIR